VRSSVIGTDAAPVLPWSRTVSRTCSPSPARSASINPLAWWGTEWSTPTPTRAAGCRSRDTVARPKTNLPQSALRSNAAACRAPIRSCTMHAFAGCGWSGVEVATTRKRSSSGSRPAACSAAVAAFAARAEVASTPAGPPTSSSSLPTMRAGR
jgi:hypothetical protein